MELIFYSFFGVCFICHLFRTSYHVLENRKSKFVKSKKFYLAISISMFFLWFSWFAMSFNDPIKMNLSLLKYFGLLLFIVGVVFVVLSHIKIKGYDTEKLYTNGIYSKIRHPMYLGFILWIIGLPIFLQGFITLLSAVIWIPQIMYWKSSEEKDLEKKFKNYKEYEKKTWF